MSQSQEISGVLAGARWHKKGAGRLFGMCAAVGLALASGTALGQTAMPPAPRYPTDGAQPLYYKDGNGPNASYVQRWIPSDNYGTAGCTSPSAPDAISQFLSPLKCVRLGDSGHSYIVFNGTERLRMENFQYGGLGVKSTSNAAGVPTAAPGQGIGASTQREGYLTHTALGADLHLTDNLRAYGQLDNATYSGRQLLRPGPSANGRNDLSVIALFAEGRTQLDSSSVDSPLLNHTILGLRIGRENLGFGSDGFWFAPNGGTNLAGTSFDGVHAFADQGSTRLDLFAAHIVNEVNFNPNNGDTVLQDRDNARQLMWGGYFSHDLPRFSFLGAEGKTGIDAFYYGYSNSAGQYTNSAFLKVPSSQAIASGGVSFITAHDYRHSLGLRFYGAIDNFTFDYSGVLQRGSFGGYDVAAWAFHTVTGYNVARMPWNPWLGVQIDGASGGVSQASKGGSNTVMTFQPMRQNALAISTISVDQALSNVISLSPRFDLHPRFAIGSFVVENLVVSVRNNFYFRQQENDAIYAGVYFGNQTAPGANPYQLSAIKRGQYIGYQPNLRLSWAFAPHFSYGLDLAFHADGPALKTIGGKDTLYIRNQVVFDF
jgi:hypothetical protein